MGKLHIAGELDINSYLTAATTFYISSKNDTSIIFRHGSTEYARINPSGCLCINTTSDTDAYKLYVSGASLFSSSAYFRSNIWANNSAIGGSIAFLPTRSTDNNATGLINYYACGSTSATSYNLGSFYFTQYSYTSGTYNRVEYYDRYNLPAVAANKTSNNTYSILTTKNTITVAQGGTGRASLTSGYALVGNGTSAVSLREITSTATSGSTALITSGGAYSAVATSITNITRSGTTFTATRANGTTFTFTQQDNNTDTKNTAGSTNSSSKLFLIGATSQAANPQTYSHDTAYVSTDGCLYSNSTKVSVDGHTHSYLPLSGGTITGSVTFSKSNNYYDIATGTGGSILLNNGDIAGVNSIYFKDAANSVGEGLMFYRSATTVDALRAYNGVLYFSPNYDSAAGTQDGNYTVVHSGNYTSYQVNTDTKVQQSRSTSSSWRPLLSHYTATTQGTNPEAATNVVYYNEKASVQPSTGKIYSAGGFIGNASTATKLATARTISLTGSVTGSGSFDGSGNLSIATTTNHSHSYVPLSGGSMSGQLSISINSPGTNPGTQHIILNGQNGSTAVANAPGLAMHIGNQNWSTLKFLYDGSWRFYNNACTAYMPIYCSKTVISNYGSTLPSSGATGEVFFKI